MQKQDFNAWDIPQLKKKTHLHVCKRYLEVSNKASNAGISVDVSFATYSLDCYQRLFTAFSPSKMQRK